MLGAEDAPQQDKGWQVAFSWRYQVSDRHFRGSHEERNRQAEHSEVINWINQAELTISRNFGPRFSLSVGIPYLMAVRSNPIRDPNQNNEVVARSQTRARGLGDVTVVPKWWLLDPARFRSFNLAFGVGVKIPTGDNSVQDSRRVLDPNTGNLVNQAPRTVDQSIQPGDGGFGLILDLSGHYRFGRDKGAAYFSGTYLANPEEDNDVPTYRNGAGEEVMSVADQYLYRVGGAYFPGKGVGLSLGYRIEGVAVHDLIGKSGGFRRPGFAASIEPGISYTRSGHTVALAVPWAIRRDRKASVPDRENYPRHGDAAFADYVILATYIRKF